MKKQFRDAFGKSYTVNLISRMQAEATLRNLHMPGIIAKAYQALPEVSGRSIDVYLDCSDASLQYISLGTADGVVQSAHLVRIYTLKFNDVHQIPDSDIAGDDRIPKGGVRKFSDYEERIVTCLESYWEELAKFNDQEGTWQEALDEIYMR